jgi:hypothetical protein
VQVGGFGLDEHEFAECALHQGGLLGDVGGNTRVKAHAIIRLAALSICADREMWWSRGAPTTLCWIFGLTRFRAPPSMPEATASEGGERVAKKKAAKKKKKM